MEMQRESISVLTYKIDMNENELHYLILVWRKLLWETRLYL